jgi:hypothetical protein
LFVYNGLTHIDVFNDRFFGFFGFLKGSRRAGFGAQEVVAVDAVAQHAGLLPWKYDRRVALSGAGFHGVRFCYFLGEGLDALVRAGVSAPATADTGREEFFFVKGTRGADTGCDFA